MFHGTEKKLKVDNDKLTKNSETISKRLKISIQ